MPSLPPDAGLVLSEYSLNKWVNDSFPSLIHSSIIGSLLEYIRVQGIGSGTSHMSGDLLPKVPV